MAEGTPARRSSTRIVTSAVRVLVASLRVVSRRCSRVVPRSPRLWVFGTRGDLYNDNPMYLYEYVRREVPGVTAVWVTGDAALARRLRRGGRRAVHRASPRGIWTLLRAKVNVYSTDPADTSYAFTGGAINATPYHGLPIKQIEFDNEAADARNIYHPSSPIARLRSHTIYAPKWEFQDVFATSSQWAEEQFRRSYQGRIGEVVLGCAPRLEAVLCGTRLPQALFPTEDRLARQIAERGGRVLLFAPTWRPYEWGVEEVLGGAIELERSLSDSNTTLLVKSHLFASSTYPSDGRVVAVPSSVDITAILAHVDGLITDYSSVGLDAALLGLPVIWAPVDRGRYHELASPRFDLDYDRLIGDRQVSGPGEFRELINSGRWSDWLIPDEVLDEVWGSRAVEQVRSGNRRFVAALTRKIEGR